jgi:hypothetical protein
MKTDSILAGRRSYQAMGFNARRWLTATVATLFTFFMSFDAAHCADANSPSSSGAIEFAGRVARNYWYLFGPEKRAELETLNRELREANLEIQTTRKQSTRLAATNRIVTADARVLDHVKSCPRLIRLDLTAQHPVCKPAGPFELPGDTGALLFEVTSGGDGVSYGTSAFDWSTAPGDLAYATSEVADFRH